MRSSINVPPEMTVKKLLIALSFLSLPVLTPVLLPAQAYAAPTSRLGSLSTFERIARDTLDLVAKADLKAAKKRITDFETAWDAAEPTLYPQDKVAWSLVDDAADAAISSLRIDRPNADKAREAIAALIVALENPSPK